MRICIDLDGTICEFRQAGQTYADVLPKPGVKDFLDALHANGHVLIIYTARNMKTQGHNVGRAVKNIGKITLDWLDQHQIPYDEIFFGKPNADVMIDDRALRFESWAALSEEKLLQVAKAE